MVIGSSHTQYTLVAVSSGSSVRSSTKPYDTMHDYKLADREAVV